jgi:hypothetical protein
MAFVQTADETASLLKLLRHRGGSVDRKLFWGCRLLVNRVKCNAQSWKFSPRFGGMTLTSFDDPGL